MLQVTRLKRLTRVTQSGMGGVFGPSTPGTLVMPGQEYLTSDALIYQNNAGEAMWVIPEWMALATSDAGLYLTTDQGYYLTTGSFYVSNGILRAQ